MNIFLKKQFRWDEYLNYLYTFEVVNSIEGSKKDEIHNNGLVSCLEYINIRHTYKQSHR